MKATKLLPVLLAFLTGSAAGVAAAPLVAAPSPPFVVEEQATIFFGGKILLNDSRGTASPALLERGGKVVAVGTRADLEAMPEAKGAALVDLRGGVAVPGLQDAHGHLASYGASLTDVDLRGCASFEQVVDRVAARAATEKENVWIVGRGWDQNLWADKALPHHEMLSRRTPRNPVFLTRVDGHAGIANRLALTAAKLDHEYGAEPKMQGGRLLLDADKRPSGVLLDDAMDIVRKTIPPPTRRQIEARILAAEEKLLAFGLTCIHDMGTTREELDVLKELRVRSRLRLRIVSYIAGNGDLPPEALEDLPLPPDANDQLACPGMKLVADGALGSRGAALLTDYSDAPGERGYLILDVKQLSTKIALCQAKGLQPAVHAIGDRANRTVLDVYETLLTVHPEARALRPRIEHAQVVSLKDWPRFPALGVIPSMQPVHAVSDMPWAVERLGKERARGAYAWRGLAPQLRALAFGSDFPVESPDPLAGLYAARTRSTPSDDADSSLFPDQSLDGASALEGFTIGAAYACHQEDRRGRLLPGYGCDMTVLTVDPVRCDPAQLLGAKATMTIVNGEVVWRAK